MTHRLNNYLFIAALLVAFVLWLAACGGDSTTPDSTGDVYLGDNSVPLYEADGGTQYEGWQPEPQIDPPAEGGEDPKELDLGQNIFAVPFDTNGIGRVVVNDFQPGKKVAFVVVNTNPIYLDAHAYYVTEPADEDDEEPTTLPVFPQLADARYTVQADFIYPGTASALAPESEPLVTLDELVSLENYQGIESSGELQSPAVIYEREALANGLEPYAALPGDKATSQIQKGEVIAFEYVAPRAGRRPIPPDPEDPEQDTSEFQFPPGYNCQSGRLVSIGAHCLVFLTTEINDGHPDTIQFTEARLHRLAREFDENIFPKATAAFGPVVSYMDNGLYRDVDRYLDPPITGADFNEENEFARSIPGTIAQTLERERKIAVFLYNGEAGGFFVHAEPDADDPGVWGVPFAVGSTIYIGTDNFPPNDNAWESGYSIMAHEFQHKLYSDHGLPQRPIVFRGGNYNWLNEGLSQLDIHICGYTVNSGRIVPWAIDGQLTDYLTHCNQSAVPMDGNEYFSQQTQYGNGFLFFLYLYEHYEPGIGRRIYAAADTGLTDYIQIIEKATGEPFEHTYIKFAIANYVDGIYKPEESDLFADWFHYDTVDLRGTVNLATGTVVLPGVRTGIFPEAGSYPIEDIHRSVFPWGTDYLKLGFGTYSEMNYDPSAPPDLSVTFYTDRHFNIFLLPVSYNEAINKVEVTPGVTID